MWARLMVTLAVVSFCTTVGAVVTGLVAVWVVGGLAAAALVVGGFQFRAYVVDDRLAARRRADAVRVTFANIDKPTAGGNHYLRFAVENDSDETIRDVVVTIGAATAVPPGDWNTTIPANCRPSSQFESKDPLEKSLKDTLAVSWAALDGTRWTRTIDGDPVKVARRR